MQLTAHEEILVELYRGLHPEQRNEVIKRMRALIDANKIVMAEMGGKPLRIVADARIEARFGKTPAPHTSAPKRDRKPDRNQDDTDPQV